MTAAPRETKLGHALRALGKDLDPIKHERCETAAMRLDHTALTLGATGARVKTLGAYYQALDVYRMIAGQPYED